MHWQSGLNRYGTSDLLKGFWYFIAILKDNSQIVSKEVFEVTLKFDQKGFARSREIVTQHIPTIEQARRYNYEVLIGFQMDAQDVVFNMER